MFTIDKDLTIYVTRGDSVLFAVAAKQKDGTQYTFQAGDVVRMTVYAKKKAESVVLQKDFPVTSETETVEIFLTKKETKIGNVISKPTDYWYEVELNPLTHPQTIIGYDEDGPKIFKLFPEGERFPEKDEEESNAIVPIIDGELDLTSTRPVENQAVARAVTRLRADIDKNKAEATKKNTATNNALLDLEKEVATEKSRIDNLVSGATINDAEVIDARVGSEGQTYSNLRNAIVLPTERIESEFDGIFQLGNNLINEEELQKGFFVNQTNGEISTGSTHHLSPFIRINPNTVYRLDSFFNLLWLEEDTSKRYALYDAEQKFISGGVNIFSFTTPENARFIRVSVSVNNKIMLHTLGESQSDYEPYSKYIKKALIENAIGEVFETKLSELTESTANLFNPSQITPGYCVVQGNGTLYTVANHLLSEYIEVKGGANYVFGFFDGVKYDANTYELRYALYNKDKEYLRGDYRVLSLKTPKEAKYIRFSYYNNAPDLIFCEGSELPEYVNFKKQFKSFLIDGYTRAEINNMLGNGEAPILNLPSVVYGLVDEELNIYFDNLVDGHDTDYTFNVTCSVGQQMERCYRVTPTEAGEFTLKIDATRKRDNSTASKVCTLKIADKTAKSDVSVLVIGDSTTANGICVGKLVENFESDATKLTMLGTKGAYPAFHEGKSGWTFKMFVEEGDSNAFYNPDTDVFDMAYYMSKNNIKAPDVVIINLGINDCFSFVEDATLREGIAKINGYCETMITSIRSSCPAAKICIALTIPPNYSQDAFGKGYKCGQTQWRYKRNNVLWVSNLISLYDGREDENIYVVPIHTNLDTIYNMGMEEIQHNKRNENTYNSPIANGGVHPVESGYWQIADVYWFFLKNII